VSLHAMLESFLFPFCQELEIIKHNHKGGSSTGQILSLLSRDHQFESHKPQIHWRLRIRSETRCNRVPQKFKFVFFAKN
jgi:hypothetical protein